LRDNIEIVEYLFDNDFAFEDLEPHLQDIQENLRQNRKVKLFDEEAFIREGAATLVQRNKYERSSQLRRFAIEHFTVDSKISCKCCHFNFEDFYGEVGKGYIEIHHIKPVSMYEDEDLEQKIKEAVKNLIPVCSNCHRIIHRRRKSPLEIAFLSDQVKRNGKYESPKE